MKQRNRILLVTAILAIGGSAALGGVSYAGRDGGGWKRHHMGMGHHRSHGMLEKFDTNGDGKVTKEEIEAAQADLLARYDADNKGGLKLEEFEGVWLELTRERMVDRFQDLDADGDGTVTKAEIDRKLARMMQVMDRDGDGAISADDFGKKHRRGHHDEKRKDDD